MIVEEFIDITKSNLIHSIIRYAVKHGMNQTDMSYLLETSQPRVSDLFNEKLDKFSVDQLLKWTYNLGINVTIQTN